MRLTESERRNVAGRASTLTERIRNDHRLVGPPKSSAFDRLAQWRETGANDDPAQFETRLALQGLTRRSAVHYLHDRPWPTDELLPDWATRLNRHLETVAGTAPHSASDLPEDVPFSHVLTPIVDEVSSQIDWDVPGLETVASTARASLRRWLLTRLSNVVAQPLHVEFTRFLLDREPELVEQREDADAVDSPGRDRYLDYCRHLTDGGLKQLFLDYPLAARFVSVVSHQWRTAVDEFVRRLGDDLSEIEATIADCELDRVTDVVPGEGDRHDHGRTVFVVEFDGDVRVVYKPRPVETKTSLNAVLDWVANHDRIPFSSFRTPALVDSGEYGWEEMIEHDPLAHTDDAAEYYRRLGVILATLHAINMTDCHAENLVASGTHPVVIDAETAVNRKILPQLVPNQQFGELVKNAAVNASILETLMLPYQVEYFDSSPDISAICSIGPQPTNRAELVWTHVNTDLVSIEYEPMTFPGQENFPVASDGNPVRPGEHLSALVDGFERGYWVLSNDSDATTHVLETFGDTDVRYLFRETRDYQITLDTITNPAYLKSGADFGVKLDSLVAPMLDLLTENATELRPIFSAEKRSLSRLDVPRFTGVTTERALRYCGETTMETAFTDTLSEKVEERLGRFSERRLEKQVSLLHRCIEGADER